MGKHVRHREEVLRKLQKLKAEFQSTDAYDIMHLLPRHGIPASTFYGWATDTYKDDKEICDIIELLKDESRNKLERKGLDGETSPVITKLVLSARYNMAERRQQDVAATVQSVSKVVIIGNDGKEIEV